MLSLLLWIDKVTTADHPDRLWYHNLPATFFFFIPGMLLALVRLELEARPRRWLEGPAGSSALWLAGAGLVWLVIFHDYGRTPLAAVAAFLMLGACVLPLRESRARRLLDLRLLAALGVASYSLYVWHSRVMEHLTGIDGFPQGTVALMAITLAASVAVAFASYRIVEAPFLRLRRRWSTASAPIEEPPRPQPAASAG